MLSYIIWDKKKIPHEEKNKSKQKQNKKKKTKKNEKIKHAPLKVK